MGYVIFIHGMGHNPDREYWRNWGLNLLPYLKKQGLDSHEVNFAGIYYYDLVPQPGDGWQKVTSIFKREVMEELRRDLWEHVVRGGDVSQMLGRGPVDGLVNLVADNFGDIFTYLLKDEVFQRVNQRFYSTLAQFQEPVTLVAYSLGTMISFCALQQKPELDQKVNHFITVGSPIFWFRTWLRQRVKLTKRPIASQWTNLAGKLDVACPHLVSYSCCSPDSQVEWELEQFSPVKGHLAYFSDPESLQIMAKAIVQQWVK